MLVCSDLFIFVVRLLFRLFYDLVDCFVFGFAWAVTILSVLCVFVVLLLWLFVIWLMDYLLCLVWVCGVWWFDLWCLCLEWVAWRWCLCLGWVACLRVFLLGGVDDVFVVWILGLGVWVSCGRWGCLVLAVALMVLIVWWFGFWFAGWGWLVAGFWLDVCGACACLIVVVV